MLVGDTVQPESGFVRQVADHKSKFQTGTADQMDHIDEPVSGRAQTNSVNIQISLVTSALLNNLPTSMNFVFSTTKVHRCRQNS